VLLVFLTGILVPVQMVLLPLFTIYFKAHLAVKRGEAASIINNE
jgi:ABC-type glycerol-3-phosphate transport system permease component